MDLGVGSAVKLVKGGADVGMFGFEAGTLGTVIHVYANGDLRVSFQCGTEARPEYLRETVRPSDVELAVEGPGLPTS